LNAGAVLVVVMVVALAGCTATSNIDHPVTKGLTYPQALRVIKAWCPTAAISVDPGGLPGAIDPNLLYVASEVYRGVQPAQGTSTPPQSTSTPVHSTSTSANVLGLAPVGFVVAATSASTSSPSHPSSAAAPSTVAPCDPSATTTVTLRLETTVPDVTNLTVGDAVALLDKRGLGLDLQGVKVPDSAIVVSQVPAGDGEHRILLDGVPLAKMHVAVTVKIKVPDLVGRPETNACDTVTGAGLGACTTNVSGNGPAPGRVTSQDPKADTLVEPGTAVQLEILRELARVPVPNVVDLSPDEACAVLTAQKLGCKTTGQSDVDLDPQVTAQDPAAGAQEPPGALVLLTVENRLVRVPSVLGTASKDACQQLADAGLACQVSSPTGPGEPGHVSSQEPKDQTIVARGATVTVAVPTGVTVPDVRHRSPQDACDALVAASLSCPSANVPTGNQIVAQDPPAGSQVAEGTEVQLIANETASSSTPLWIYVLGAAVLIVAAVIVTAITRSIRGPGAPSVAVRLDPGQGRVRADEAREW
jgi:beta-lactam-binding protein with PASTA domain